MVRFIINMENLNELLTVIIYIPIWLDLLLTRVAYGRGKLLDLHSNMVRFII